ncbi:MAG: hypothetical protein GQ477_03465 [Nanohaloarchaea archaeon]|nr:hypothetical protein [Candidatus Nanohaloarchaea archaeon]
MDRVLRTEETNIKLLKILVPKLLIGCRQYLDAYSDFDDELTYDDIATFYPEHRGNMDECGGHYQMDTRINSDVIPHGRINFSYNDRFGSALDIHVTDQGSGNKDVMYKERVDEIVDHIKCLLDRENMAYNDVPIEQ